MNFIGDISFTSVNNDDIMKRIVDNERLQRPDLDLEQSTITLRHLYIKTNKDAKMIINENDTNISFIIRKVSLWYYKC